jgi:hypothetical protein
MQEIPRAILLPPPGSAASRASARATNSADHDLPVEIERGGRRAAGTTGSFLTLVDTRREDSVEFSGDFRGKQFRFRPYTNRGGVSERGAESSAIERPAARNLAAADEAEGQAASDVLDGFSSGDGRRNSTAFLASFIAQEQLSEGLYNPPYAGASDAYRHAGGSPPAITDRPRVVSFAA